MQLLFYVTSVVKTDKYFMRCAFKQAQLGRGVCAPNPSVGAVLVHNNKIISKAFHLGVGFPHAEQVLLQHITINCTELVLYVTLEPCNHWGKTPPCVDIIIAKKISRVVFGYYDPNPIVSKNNTVSLLKQHGIEVIHLPLLQIDLFYNSYKYWLLYKQPWIQAKIAHSLDGKIAKIDERVQLSNAHCMYFTHIKRLYTDVILTTARTINIDNPQLNVRLKNPHTSKIIAIIDKNLTLTGNELVFTTAKLIHLFHSVKLLPQKILPNCCYHPITENEQLLNLRAIINLLGSIGYHDVWVEAGGKLFSELHRLQLVNQSYFYIVPQILGENAVTAYYNQQIFDIKHKIFWQKKNDNMIMHVEWC